MKFEGECVNDWEKNKLREHWQKPGKLRMLLEILPMVPDTCSGDVYKRVVWMTGIAFDPAEMAQVYYMLEEDGVLVRDGVEPGQLLRYRLAKDLTAY
jgi:hypothetical protein